MATPKKKTTDPAVTRLEYDYMRLDELLEHRWDLNPKLHQTAAIHQSITDYGFNDPVGFDAKWKLVLEGHGRLEDLDARYRARMEGNEMRPQHIDVDPKDGMWLVPVTKKQFPSRETALLYALAHNRTNTARYVPEDYDPVKMDKIRKMLGDAGQLKMAGFGEEDAVGSGVSTLSNFNLPELKPFDSIDLPDGAGAEGTAPESFVLMVTFPTFMQMKEAIRVLTLGDRVSLSQTARLAKFDGGEYLVKWRAMMAGEGLEEALAQARKENAQEAPAPLLEFAKANPIPAEQLFSQTERGDFPALMPAEDIRDRAAAELGIDPRTPPSESDPAWQAVGAPVGYSATEMEVGGSEEPTPSVPANALTGGSADNNADYVPDWDLTVPLDDDFYKDAAKPAKKDAAKKKEAPTLSKPNWVGGLCRACGGNGGLKGNPKNGVCDACEGYQTEEAYNSRNVEKQGTLL